MAHEQEDENERFARNTSEIDEVVLGRFLEGSNFYSFLYIQLSLFFVQFIFNLCANLCTVIAHSETATAILD